MNDMASVEGTSTEILREIANSLKSLPQIVEAIQVRERAPEAAKEAPENFKISRLEKAMVLMFRTKHPSVRLIATAMGYKSHGSLYKIKGFQAIFDRYKQFLEYSGPSLRSAVNESDSDWTGEDDI